MIYRFRVILDTKEDILRDIEIEATASLEDFHYANSHHGMPQQPEVS